MAFLEQVLLGTQKMRLNRESLTIPKDFADIIRSCSTPECYITVAQKRLMLFPLGSWQEYRRKLSELDDPEARTLLHYQLKYGSKVTELDASGRIKLPHLLYEFLKEPDEVYIAGMGDYLEIYAKSEHKSGLNDEELNKMKPPEHFIL
ncbi:MAG: hypothetical protein K9N06_00975 [Candidatus Cloacimonetes bacterium]|nr:hypothetical protein [Candidatus Cloacimonadota bacterium]